MPADCKTEGCFGAPGLLLVGYAEYCDTCLARRKGITEQIETTSATENTKPLFEDWWRDLAAGDRYRFSFNDEDIWFEVREMCVNSAVVFDCRGKRVGRFNDDWYASEYADLIPIPRDADRAQLRSTDTSGSSRQQRTPANPGAAATAWDRAIDELNRDIYARVKHTLPRPGSALPETSGTPNQRDCSAPSDCHKRWNAACSCTPE